MFDRYGKYDTISGLHHMRIAFVILIIISENLILSPACYPDEALIQVAGLKFPKYVTVSEKGNAPGEAESKDRQKGEEADFQYRAEEVQVLKRAGTERIGAASSYEEFSGLRFGRYFTIGQRVEIFQEAKPIDSYILDAKHIRILGQGGAVMGWDTDAHFRSQITPLFTRAYGTQLTIDDPEDTSGQIAQIRYTLDYRDTYREYYPKWPHLLWANWLQNEILFLHSMKIPGINWYYTSNVGYKYSTIVQKDAGLTPTNSGYENRHTYFLSLSLAPSARFEWFGQFEYFKSNRPRSTFAYSPDHWFYTTELRFKTPDMRTSIIPSFSYSADYYFPLNNRFEKYELGLRVGRDFSNKLSATTQLEYVLSLRDEPDNTAPTYAAPNPFKDSASYVGWENRVSYNIYDKFYLQGGLDIAAGTNMSDFDNWGTFVGLEYYNPGLLRANFGWDTNVYYNIDDFLNTIGFRVYIFM